MTRLNNGSAAIHLYLPPEIHDEDNLAVEVNWSGMWIRLDELHLPSFFDSSKDYHIEIRLQLGKWTGYANITVPAISDGDETEQGEQQNTLDVVLTYVVIFGTLLITCTVLLAIILGLKYAQWSHREQDKSKYGI